MKLGCCVSGDRWFWLILRLRAVLRAVGLRGLGESGVLGMDMAAGEGREREGTPLTALEMLRESFGLATRVYIVSEV